MAYFLCQLNIPVTNMPVRLPWIISAIIRLYGCERPFSSSRPWHLSMHTLVWHFFLHADATSWSSAPIPTAYIKNYLWWYLCIFSQNKNRICRIEHIGSRYNLLTREGEAARIGLACNLKWLSQEVIFTIRIRRVTNCSCYRYFVASPENKKTSSHDRSGQPLPPVSVEYDWYHYNFFQNLHKFHFFVLLFLF